MIRSVQLSPYHTNFRSFECAHKEDIARSFGSDMLLFIVTNCLIGRNVNIFSLMADPNHFHVVVAQIPPFSTSSTAFIHNNCLNQNQLMGYSCFTFHFSDDL